MIVISSVDDVVVSRYCIGVTGRVRLIVHVHLAEPVVALIQQPYWWTAPWWEDDLADGFSAGVVFRVQDIAPGGWIPRHGAYKQGIWNELKCFNRTLSFKF